MSDAANPLQVRKVLQGKRGLPGHLGQPPQDHKGRKDLRDRSDRKAPPAIGARLARRALKDRLGHKGRRVTPDRKARLGLRVHGASRVRKGLLVRPDPLGHLAHKEMLRRQHPSA